MVKLGEPAKEVADNPSLVGMDTDNLNIEYIDDTIGEPWWHMQAPGARIPGSPDGWMPPREPENWLGYHPKLNSGEPLEEDIDNPGSWNLYSFASKYAKKISTTKHLQVQLSSHRNQMEKDP
jgi:hypothetical protein